MQNKISVFIILSLVSSLFFERVLKEAIHEFGVSRGLKSCPDPRCVMHFSNSLADIDKKRNTLCRECRDKLLHQYMSPLIKASLKPLI
jgi:archaemetzincin